MEIKGIQIKFKKQNKIAQRLSVRIPIVIKSSTFIKNVTS